MSTVSTVRRHDVSADGGMAPDIAAWLDSAPALSGDFKRDRDAFSAWWGSGRALQRRIGAPPPDSADRPVLDAVRAAGCSTRHGFARVHGRTLYDLVAGGGAGLARLETVVAEAPRHVPFLVPTEAELAEESARPLAQKLGYEMEQGMLLAGILEDADAGTRLCHAMMLPLPESLARLDEYRSTGRIDLGTARLERRDGVAWVSLSNPRFLNAEDRTTLLGFEMAADLALLDPESQICVLRGAPVDHPKFGGRRLFSAGINLTRLYRGEIPYLFYLIRDLGFLNKMHRGVARPDLGVEEAAGGTTEKLWIAQVDAFAIGGGCQLLLVMDHIVAGRDAYATLPARKEGIIPGCANLRLPRFVGDRIARQAILNELRIDFDTPVGRMLADEVVAPEEMDAAVERTARRLVDSGSVSATGNRRTLRVGAEPFDLMRNYYAVYAREQAWCHLSPALVANLERFWDAAQRRA